MSIGINVEEAGMKWCIVMQKAVWWVGVHMGCLRNTYVIVLSIGVHLNLERLNYYRSVTD